MVANHTTVGFKCCAPVQLGVTALVLMVTSHIALLCYKSSREEQVQIMRTDTSVQSA